MTRRPLWGLLAAEAVSFTGSRVTFVAVPWLVLETTGSAARTGLVAFAEMLPYVVASALVGPVVDRRAPRRLSIAADLASVVTVALVPILYGLDLLPFSSLLALVAVAGAVRGTGDIAKGALFPAAVETSGVDMARATALHDGVGRLSFLLGGALAGILLAWTGAATVLLLDAASFAVAAVLVAAFVRTSGPAVAVEHEPYRVALVGGVRHVASDRLLRSIVLVVLVTNLLDQAYLGVLVPVWVHDVLRSPSALGVMLAAFGAGAVAGNALYTWLAPRLPRFASFSICFLLSGGPQILVLAVTRSLAAVAVTMFVSGVLCAAINPVLAATIYERVPTELRARTLGLVRATAWAGIPLGGLLGGFLVELVGLTAAIVAIGLVYLGAGVVPLLTPAWREMDRAPRRASPTLDECSELVDRHAPPELVVGDGHAGREALVAAGEHRPRALL